MATIKDVAKKAGVSTSTVSLVINGKRNVSKAKYKKILAAMEELNYRPSIIAQNLKKQKFHLIGVVLPSNEEYYAQIIKGLHDEFVQHKYHMIVSLTDDDAQKEASVFEELISMGVSGIISIPCDTNNIEKYKKWTCNGFPIVFLERKMADIEFSNIFFDNQKIIYKKTIELLKKYKPSEIALITSSQEFSSEEECKVGFIDAVKREHPRFSINSLEIMETTLRHFRAMHDILNRYGKDKCQIKCFIVTDLGKAELLLELQNILKYEPEIYAMGGDVWSKSKRVKSAIQEIPREATKMGQSAALLMMEFVNSDRVSEQKDILIEDTYNHEEFKRKVSIPNKKTSPLKILLLQSNAMDVLCKLAPNFTKETGVKTEFDFVPFNDLTKKLSDPSADLKYDVLWVDLPLVSMMIKIGRLLELTPWIDKDNGKILDAYPEGVLKCVKNNGKEIYGLPLLFDEGMLYYRKDVFSDPVVQWSYFDKYGFELKPPSNWSEFNCIAEFFDSACNKDSAFKYGTVLSLTKPTAVMEEFYVRQRAFNGRMIDKWKRLSIFSIENIRALESLIQSYKHSPKESLNYFFEDGFRSLLTGETPMIQGFPAHYMPFRHSELFDNYKEHISVAPIPGGRPILGGWVLGINSTSSRPDEAYEFLKWTASEELMVVKGRLGYLVPIKSMYENTFLNNYYPGLKMMNVSNYSREMREKIRAENGSIVEQFEFEQIVAEEIASALAGEKTASDALKNAHETVSDFLKK